MKLTLEVLSEDGSVLRKIDSTDKSKLKTWTGGPAKPPTLPAKPGLNRFHWDLRTDPLPGVRNIFLMGGHAGSRVVPGTYTLRLSTDQEGLEPVETSAIVSADPRVKGTEADYLAQQQALNKIRDLASNVHLSVVQFRRVKSQLAGRLALLKEMDG